MIQFLVALDGRWKNQKLKLEVRREKLVFNLKKISGNERCRPQHRLVDEASDNLAKRPYHRYPYRKTFMGKVLREWYIPILQTVCV
jgi:hypothetical protein